MRTFASAIKFVVVFAFLRVIYTGTTSMSSYTSILEKRLNLGSSSTNDSNISDNNVHTNLQNKPDSTVTTKTLNGTFTNLSLSTTTSSLTASTTSSPNSLDDNNDPSSSTTTTTTSEIATGTVKAAMETTTTSYLTLKPTKPCESWCQKSNSTWEVKCRWVTSCAACSECDSGVPTSTTTEPTKTESTSSPTVSPQAATLGTKQSSSFVWSSIPKNKKGYGVVFSAYSSDIEKTLPKYFKEAAITANDIKRQNPSMPVAIITNSANVDVPDIFDYVIDVSDAMLLNGADTRNDGISRQWFTRLYYLAHSPFEITWYVDSHAKFQTTTLKEAFVEFEQSEYDIATANQRPNSYYCHNFSILYRWNDKIRTLFIDWMLRQLQAGITKDDQGTLCRAIYCAGDAYGLKHGSISPRWSLAWLSLNWGGSVNNKNGGGDGEKSWWHHRTTQVLEGMPQICHSNDVCEIGIKTNNTSPRVLYMNSKIGKRSAQTFYSQTDIDKSNVLPYDYKWNDWKKYSTSSDGKPPGVVIPAKHVACPKPASESIINNNKKKQQKQQKRRKNSTNKMMMMRLQKVKNRKS